MNLLDASALLALINTEPGAERVQQLLSTAAMSTVNLAEVYSRCNVKGIPEAEVKCAVMLLQEVVPFSAAQALLCGGLQRVTATAGLSLGDRACLAVAIEKGWTAYTADRAWLSLRLPCEIRMIR